MSLMQCPERVAAEWIGISATKQYLLSCAVSYFKSVHSIGRHSSIFIIIAFADCASSQDGRTSKRGVQHLG